MKSKSGRGRFKQLVWSTLKGSVFGALFTIVVCVACAPQEPSVSPEQVKRFALLKSEAPNASFTILPVRVGGTPFDRATEFIGMQLEQKGLKNIELGKSAFDPGRKTDFAQITVSLGEFVKKNPITTGYALYAEIGGEGGVDEIRMIVVDKSGALVWSDLVTPRDTPWKERSGDGDLLVACTVLGEHVSSQIGLNEETAKGARPGKMAAIMAERSGLPPENETAAIPGRQEVMKKAMPHATMVVYSGRARKADNPAEAGNAANLAKMLSDAGLCKASPAGQPLLLTASQADPNEMKVMWDLAREFRDYARTNPVDADYLLYADYRFNPQMWEAGFVHLIVCDRQGEWVIADLRNSHHPEYQNIRPTSREGCDRILVEMLKGHLKENAATTTAAAAQPPMDPEEAQKVLDRLVGTWSWEATTYTSGSNPDEKHTTGRYSFTRILGGRFVEGATLADAANNAVLLMYTYDEPWKCLRYWAFSGLGGCEAPINGTWNKKTRTLDWTGLATDQQFMTGQYRFLSDDAFECTVLEKNPAGLDIYRAEYKLSRLRESQNSNLPDTGTDTPILGQTAEQKVLDQLLGTWSLEMTERKAKWTPEEKRKTGTCSFTRILGGRFVQETWEDSENNSALNLYTYDEKWNCYRTWAFGSNYGGPAAPTSAKWDEAAHTLVFFGFPANEGQKPTCYMRFVGDSEEEGIYMVQDAAGETLYRAEYKMTRISGPQK